MGTRSKNPSVRRCKPWAHKWVCTHGRWRETILIPIVHCKKCGLVKGDLIGISDPCVQGFVSGKDNVNV